VTPWGVLVSEFMLQQTQTERVIGYWEQWMARWPDAASLADEPLDTVLRAWQGLGYNRRCKHLYDTAGMIVEAFTGSVPDNRADLLRLPGIGDYSSGAIACFAYNKREVFVETNIRAAVIEHFFPPPEDGSMRDKVSDDEVKEVLSRALTLPEIAQDPRRWYYALMDYGAYLKKITPNPGRRSKTYTRQSRFEGSFRQKRAAVLRAALNHEPPPPYPRKELNAVLESLQKDGLLCDTPLPLREGPGEGLLSARLFAEIPAQRLILSAEGRAGFRD
jgi:A/G-specific adenine glycosylase